MRPLVIAVVKLVATPAQRTPAAVDQVCQTVSDRGGDQQSRHRVFVDIARHILTGARPLVIDRLRRGGIRSRARLARSRAVSAALAPPNWPARLRGSRDPAQSPRPWPSPSWPARRLGFARSRAASAPLDAAERTCSPTYCGPPPARTGRRLWSPAAMLAVMAPQLGCGGRALVVPIGRVRVCLGPLVPVACRLHCALLFAAEKSLKQANVEPS